MTPGIIGDSSHHIEACRNSCQDDLSTLEKRGEALRITLGFTEYGFEFFDFRGRCAFSLQYMILG